MLCCGQDARLPHGMGKNGGLVQLRSADPGFEPTWEEGPIGPPLPMDDEGRILPQWPSVGPEFTPVSPPCCLRHGRLLHLSSKENGRRRCCRFAPRQQGSSAPCSSSHDAEKSLAFRFQETYDQLGEQPARANLGTIKAASRGGVLEAVLKKLDA